jgi:lysophospholipase L1-like esterase
MHIALIGDSIVHGYDDQESGGWVARLKILSVAEEKSDLVFNLGIPGNSTRDILERADVEIRARQPFLNKVVYSTGTNDQGKNVPVTEFKENLTKLGKIAAGHGNKVFFMGLFLCVKDGKRRDSSDYDTAIREVCEENCYTYIPTADVIVEEDLVDGCHPNSAGHAKLCDRVAEYMRKTDDQ